MRIFCRGSKAKIISKNYPITSGSQSYFKIKFVFSHEWDKFTKVAMFFNNTGTGARYTQALTQVSLAYSIFPNYEVWECLIPKDVIAARGSLYVGVIGAYGSGDNAVMLNSTAVYCNIDFGIADLSVIQDPANDIYEQLLEEIAEIQRTSQVNWNEIDSSSMAYILNKPDISSDFDVVDNLNSTATSDALSANQGSVIGESITWNNMDED